MTSSEHDFATTPTPNVNPNALKAAVADSGANPEQFIGTIQTIIDKAGEIFRDPIYRALAVRLLTMILHLFAKA